MHKKNRSNKSHYDYVIIGAGPAGLQLGYFMEKAQRDYLILEAGDSPGTFFKTFPRHRRLISINKVYTGFDDHDLNLRWDWNSLLCDTETLLFKNYTERYFPDADVLVKYLNDYAAYYDLNIRRNFKVARVSRRDKFKVEDADGNSYTCSRLILGTGVSAPYIPPIPGIENCELYTTVSVNAAEFKNQKVLIIGKGNSAFETADNLIENAAVIHLASPHSVTMAWQTHFVGNLRAVNNNVLDTYQLKSQNAAIDGSIDRITRRDDGKLIASISYTHANNEVEDLVYDRIIVCTGFRFGASIFAADCRPEMTIDDRFPAQTSEWESTNIKDLYFIGTLTQARDFKKTTSGFIHGFRYNTRALHRMLEQKYHGREWPARSILLSPETLSQTVIERVNGNSALWQQFGFLCDLIVVPDSGSEARYYEEVPEAYVHDSELGANNHYYTVTLEYGPEASSLDPFSINRTHRRDFDNAHLSNALHPIVRRYSGSEMLREHHVIEDFASQWTEEEHMIPLLKFFRRETHGAARV